MTLRITIVGSGTVGLATGVGLQKRGHRVIFYDISDQVLRNRKADGLATADSMETAIQDADIVMLCLPTPPAADGFDLSYLEQGAKDVGATLDSQTVIIRSTVLPGTTRKLSSIIEKERLVYNPEFLREAYALEDFLNPYRIVIGAQSTEAARRVKDLYREFDAPIIQTDWETAETAKLASNAFLATKISFFNEIWRLCRRLGMEPDEVERIVALDERIGLYGTRGGPPFEGSCLPKDTAALFRFGRSVGEELKMLEATLRVNDVIKSTPSSTKAPSPHLVPATL